MLPKSWDVFFEKRRSACGRHIDHGVLGGTLKSTKIDKHHRVHAPQIQGRAFSGWKFQNLLCVALLTEKNLRQDPRPRGGWLAGSIYPYIRKNKKTNHTKSTRIL